MKNAEYSTKEMKNLLEQMSGMYDLARVVDPKECRVLHFDGDGHINMDEKCYGVWKSEQRCIHCSSEDACRTGCHREKSEHFQDKIFDIQSNPVNLKLSDGTMFDAVVELISIREKGTVPDTDDENVNDREAENVDYKAYRYQAAHDSLTKLLNADAFFGKAREVMLEKPDVKWVMITADIMEFHILNNLYGVAKGNEMIMKTAEFLQKIAKAGSGIASRLAGDHFAILLPEEKYSEGALKDTAKDLADHCTSGVYKMCIHFGVYRIRDISIPVSVMCDRANLALRTIKGDYRSTVSYFDDYMMQKRLFEQEIISLFDQELKKGHFKMYLQPLTDKEGKPFGAEALVRWKRSDGSVVSPVEFIETLEKAGLIQDLDRYIWEQAAIQLREWKDTDKKDLTISVNMSARDFYKIDLYETFTALVKKYEVDSSRLRLEITETALLEDPERSNAVLQKLQQAGFVIEIDDFGKGNSSLSMLKDIHADVIKIDMGFLRETENKKRSEIILESVIDLAKSLGMDVVTEGVETEKQLNSLYEMGCRIFQGYYFSRPIPAEEFDRKY